jgi:hypothetical protein
MVSNLLCDVPSSFTVPHCRSIPPHPHIHRTLAPPLVRGNTSHVMGVIMEPFDLSLAQLMNYREKFGVPITEAEVFHIARTMIDAIHHLYIHGFAHTNIMVCHPVFDIPRLFVQTRLEPNR